MCGYVHAEANDLLPQTARRSWAGPEEVEQEKGELRFSQVAPVLGRKGFGRVGGLREVTNHKTERGSALAEPYRGGVDDAGG